MLRRFISSRQNKDCSASLMGSKSGRDRSTDELDWVFTQSSLTSSWNSSSQQVLKCSCSIVSSIETAAPKLRRFQPKLAEKIPLTACVASVSVCFRSKERPRNRGTGFSTLAAWELKREPKKMKEEEGEGKEDFLLFFPTLPRSFTRAIFRGSPWGGGFLSAKILALLRLSVNFFQLRLKKVKN